MYGTVRPIFLCSNRLRERGVGTCIGRISWHQFNSHKGGAQRAHGCRLYNRFLLIALPRLGANYYQPTRDTSVLL